LTGARDSTRGVATDADLARHRRRSASRSRSSSSSRRSFGDRDVLRVQPGREATSPLWSLPADSAKGQRDDVQRDRIINPAGSVGEVAEMNEPEPEDSEQQAPDPDQSHAHARQSTSSSVIAATSLARNPSLISNKRIA
jgi:hypothetical protein